MLPSRYITKVKTSGKRYNRKKERSTNPKWENEDE